MIIVSVLLVIRYYAMRMMFHKTVYISVISHLPIDFGIIGILCKKSLESVKQLMETRYFKSREATHHLVAILLTVNKVFGATKVLKKTTFKPTNIPTDSEFFLFFYKRKAHVLHTQGTTKKTKILGCLRRINSCQTKLTTLLKKIWGCMLENNCDTINFSLFPSLITKIEEYEETLDKLYENALMEHGNSSGVLIRKYAAYLADIKGNNELSDMYFDRADEIELQQESFQMEIEKQPPSTILSEINSTHSLNSSASNPSKKNRITIEKQKIDQKKHLVPSSKKEEERKINQFARLKNTKSKFRKSSSFGELMVTLKNGLKRVFSKEKITPFKNKQLIPEKLPPAKRVIIREEKIKQVDSRSSTSTLSRISDLEQLHQFHSEKRSALSINGDDDDDDHSNKEDTIEVSGITSKRKYNFVYGKINSAKYFSITSLKIIMFTAILYAILGCLGLFGLFMGTNYYFERMANWINSASEVRKLCVSLRHYARKMELSFDPNTLLECEKNISYYRSTLKDETEIFLSKLNTLYETSDSYTKGIWNDVLIEFTQTITRLNTTFEHSNNLLDTMRTYGETFRILANLDDKVYENRTKGHMVFETNDFSYTMMSEDQLHMNLKQIILHNLAAETKLIKSIRVILVLIPVCGVVLMLFSFVVYVWLRLNMKKLIKSLLMLPKDAIIDVYEKISRSCTGTEEHQHFYFNNSSILEKMLLKMLMFLGIIIVIFAIVSGFTYIFIGKYDSRNRQVDATAHVMSDLRRIHLCAVELLNYQTSLIDKSQLEYEMERECNCIERTFKQLRFGDEGQLLPRSDEDPLYNDMYYKERCENFTDGKIDCRSLGWQFDQFVRNARLIKKDYEFISTDSELFFDIVKLDEKEGKEGILELRFKELNEKFTNSLDSMTSVITNLYIVFLSVFLPVITFLFLISLSNQPKKVYKTFKRVKTLFLCFPKEIIFSQNIFNFLVNQNQNLSRFFEIHHKSLSEETFSLLKGSSHLIIMFDKKYRILRMNSMAENFFRSKTSADEKVKYFPSLFSKESEGNIIKYLKRKHFYKQHEFIMVSNNHKFPVEIDLCYSKKHFLAIIRNIESQKKKQNLMKREIRKKNIGKLLKNILPPKIIEKFEFDLRQDILKQIGKNYFSVHKEATAFFCDICNFTEFVSSMEPNLLINLLNDIFSNIDNLCLKHDCEKIKTIGDAYFCVSGIPNYQPSHAEAAMEFSIDVMSFIRNYSKDNKIQLNMKIGLNSGPIVTGIVGSIKINYDCFGDCVNTAQRMEAYGIIDKIQVSRATYEYLFDKYDFIERALNIKGKGMMKAYVFTRLMQAEDNESVLSTEGGVNNGGTGDGFYKKQYYKGSQWFDVDDENKDINISSILQEGKDNENDDDNHERKEARISLRKHLNKDVNRDKNEKGDKNESIHKSDSNLSINSVLDHSEGISKRLNGSKKGKKKRGNDS